MKLGRQDQDDEIIRLLGQMRDTGPEYPSSLFSKRRAAVMAAFAALNLGAATAGLSLLAHLVKIIKGMGMIEKIILAVEVTAVTGLTAYGAATAYVYRNEIRQAIESNLGISTNTPFPSLVAPSSGGGGASATEFVGTGTPSSTPSPTGTLLYFTPTSGGGNPANTSIPPTQVQSTPAPPTVAPPTQVPPTQPPPTEPQPTSCGKGKCKGWTPTPPGQRP